MIQRVGSRVRGLGHLESTEPAEFVFREVFQAHLTSMNKNKHTKQTKECTYSNNSTTMSHACLHIHTYLHMYTNLYMYMDTYVFVCVRVLLLCVCVCRYMGLYTCLGMLDAATEGTRHSSTRCRVLLPSLQDGS